MPIKFEIYRDGARVNQFTPINAIPVGPESVPMHGDVAFRDGMLVVTRSEEHPAGVSLLWDLGELGAYEMETTRLKPREKPYNLNLELARFRLMKIVQKHEDWNLFDFPRAEKFAERFKEAQGIFSQALGRIDEPGECSKLADKALALAVDLSEELAMFHGDLLLHRRRSSGGMTKHTFGCRVDSTVQNQKYKETVADNFDHVVLPMSWKQLQPEQGVFEPGPLDDWVEMLTKKRVPIVAGPLVDLSDAGVPDWMFMFEHDFDTLRELAFEFVQKIVQRYRKHVSVWNVVAGLHTNTSFALSFEQSIELTRLLVSQVKSTLPNSRTLVTITQPYGEYNARGTASVPPLFYADLVAQAGINFDAFGLEVETGVPTSGGYMRDLFQFSCMLDRFSSMGRPVFITSLCAPGRASPDPTDRSDGQLDPGAAGRGKKPWSGATQAEWLDSAYHLALSKPYIESIAWANLADINPTIPAGGLLDDMLKPKPAFTKIQELRDALTRRK